MSMNMTENISTNYELIKILNRVEILQTRKIYPYNQMEGIASKPSLQQGGENLIEYSVNLPLHINFCDPQEWIEIVEKQAQSRTPFDWVYNGKYMGSFVIDSIEKNTQNRVRNIIIYAELTFNLLENPIETEFKEQLNPDIDLSSVEQYSENSNKFKDFAHKAKETIKENIKESISTSLISDNLSDACKELLSSSFEAVANDISAGDVTNIFFRSKELTERILQSKNLNVTDIPEALSIAKNIPQKMLSSVLRREDAA